MRIAPRLHRPRQTRAQARGWMVVLDAAKACATHPPDLSRWKPEFVVLSFYKVRPSCCVNCRSVRACASAFSRVSTAPAECVDPLPAHSSPPAPPPPPPCRYSATLTGLARSSSGGTPSRASCVTRRTSAAAPRRPWRSGTRSSPGGRAGPGWRTGRCRSCPRRL